MHIALAVHVYTNRVGNALRIKTFMRRAWPYLAPHHPCLVLTLWCDPASPGSCLVPRSLQLAITQDISRLGMTLKAFVSDAGNR